MDETRMFEPTGPGRAEIQSIVREVTAALREKGYDPVVQIVGYLLSGDPAYITSHLGARSQIRRVARDEIVEELVRSYIERS